MSSIPLILEIQAEAIDASASVTALLRKAKVAATKLDLAQDLQWIQNELSGYPDTTSLPEYRKLFGALKGKNPFNGWLPVQFPEGHSEVEETVRTVWVTTPIPELESLIKRQAEQKSGELVYQLAPAQTRMIQGWIGHAIEIANFVGASKVQGIMESVRNLVLNWSLELEKAGIRGEGLTFTPQDKALAAPASQQFFIQNVGTLGNISGQAVVTNIQTAGDSIDPDLLARTISEIRSHLKAAPESLQNTLPTLLDDVERESKSAKPDQSKVRRLLQSAKVAAEGAAGSLIASGIAVLLSKLLE